MIRAKLLEFVKCPACRAPFAVQKGEAGERLVCRNADCRRSYGTINETIPDLVVESAEIMDEDSWQAVLDEAGAKPAEPDAEPRVRRDKSRRDRD